MSSLPRIFHAFPSPNCSIIIAKHSPPSPCNCHFTNRACLCSSEKTKATSGAHSKHWLKRGWPLCYSCNSRVKYGATPVKSSPHPLVRCGCQQTTTWRASMGLLRYVTSLNRIRSLDCIRLQRHIVHICEGAFNCYSTVGTTLDAETTSNSFMHLLRVCAARESLTNSVRRLDARTLPSKQIIQHFYCILASVRLIANGVAGVATNFVSDQIIIAISTENFLLPHIEGNQIK